MMRTTVRKVEKLEDAFGIGVAQPEPHVIRVNYVSTDGEVVGGYEVRVGQSASTPETLKA